MWFAPPVEPLRCLIDSMVFDAIAADPDLLARIDRLTRARALELLAAAETMREIDATPDRARRRLLQRVRVLVVPPADAPPVILDRLQAGADVSDEDARIALAAAEQEVPLVTEDRALRAAAAEHLPLLVVWSWPELLERLEAL